MTQTIKKCLENNKNLICDLNNIKNMALLKLFFFLYY